MLRRFLNLEDAQLSARWRMLCAFLFPVRFQSSVIILGAAISLFSPAVGNAAEVSLGGGEMTSEGSFKFSFPSDISQSYPIAVSIDLLNWRPLTNLPGIRGTRFFTDENA